MIIAVNDTTKTAAKPTVANICAIIA